MTTRLLPKQRFMKYVSLDDANRCWLWTSAMRGGYGVFWLHGHCTSAHRVSWSLHHGPIPADMNVLHKCDTPACVNPAHLFLGTQQDNADDMLAKGRGRYDTNPPRGERQWQSKLSAEHIKNIRSDDRSQIEIAHDYGICPSHVSKIKSRKRWQHLGEM